MEKKFKTMLAEGPVTFTFTKKNGVKRKMTATINSNFIPENKEVIQKSNIVLCVYDLENEGFRNISINADIIF